MTFLGACNEWYWCPCLGISYSLDSNSSFLFSLNYKHSGAVHQKDSFSREYQANSSTGVLSVPRQLVGSAQYLFSQVLLRSCCVVGWGWCCRQKHSHWITGLFFYTLYRGLTKSQWWFTKTIYRQQMSTCSQDHTTHNGIMVNAGLETYICRVGQFSDIIGILI